MPKLMLDRAAIAQLAQGVPRTISALEKIFSDVDGALPSDINEAHAAASQAMATAQSSMEAVALLAEASEVAGHALAVALACMERVNLLAEALAPLECMPRAHLGTISGQDANAVDISGGTAIGVAVSNSTIDNCGINATPIGQQVAAAARFTTVSASGQITANAPGNVAPFVVNSATMVENLNVRSLQGQDWGTPLPIGTGTPNVGAFTNLRAYNGFGCNGKSEQGSYPLGGAATDLDSAIALANNMRIALISNGIGQ